MIYVYWRGLKNVSKKLTESVKMISFVKCLENFRRTYFISEKAPNKCKWSGGFSISKTFSSLPILDQWFCLQD